jgi:hypothetical protein
MAETIETQKPLTLTRTPISDNNEIDRKLPPSSAEGAKEFKQFPKKVACGLISLKKEGKRSD